MSIEELVNVCLSSTRSLGVRLNELVGRVNTLESGVGATITKALSGDMVVVISPTSVNREETSVAWNRTVNIALKTAAGEIHTWFSATVTGILSVADDSIAGTASIVSANLTFVNGEASVIVSGDSENWLSGETDTLTIASISILGYTITGGTSVQTFIPA